VLKDRELFSLLIFHLTKFRPIPELEKFSQSYSKASSLSYAAGIADFDSVNNFSKEDAEEARNDNSNLAQTKEAILEAKASLDRLVALLQKQEELS
jgi:hypothetical protein